MPLGRKLYRAACPNTFSNKSVTRAAGCSRIFFSSLAIIRNRPSRASRVT